MWAYFGTANDGQKMEMYGINLPDYEWENTGEKVEIVDPLHKQNLLFTVFKITANNISFEFLAGEFSNGVWGFYTNNKGAIIL
jgi:hypothetical protein